MTPNTPFSNLDFSGFNLSGETAQKIRRSAETAGPNISAKLSIGSVSGSMPPIGLPQICSAMPSA